MNIYRYVGNNPLIFTDSFGLLSVSGVLDWLSRYGVLELSVDAAMGFGVHGSIAFRSTGMTFTGGGGFGDGTGVAGGLGLTSEPLPPSTGSTLEKGVLASSSGGGRVLGGALEVFLPDGARSITDAELTGIGGAGYEWGGVYSPSSIRGSSSWSDVWKFLTDVISGRFLMDPHPESVPPC